VNIELALHDLGLEGETFSELSVEHATRIAATIGVPTQFRRGEPLPLLWHWAYFTPTTLTADLGTDGHPRLPAGPTSGYPRRMWASGSLVARGQLVVGEPATRTTSVVGAKQTVGGSGPLLIVKLAHRYHQSGEPVIDEEQTLIYRQAGSPVPLPLPDDPPRVLDGEWEERHRPDSRLLFRFSSITFNSHRIHYDQPYAASEEGYPALVVHGPLTTLLVGEAIRRRSAVELARFEFRATAPLFVDQTFTIVGTPGNPVAVRVVRTDGVEAMVVNAELADWSG
jgi:3-methylfumaryl-CoA hydratase